MSKLELLNDIVAGKQYGAYTIVSVGESPISYCHVITVTLDYTKPINYYNQLELKGYLNIVSGIIGLFNITFVLNTSKRFFKN